MVKRSRLSNWLPSLYSFRNQFPTALIKLSCLQQTFRIIYAMTVFHCKILWSPFLKGTFDPQWAHHSHHMFNRQDHTIMDSSWKDLAAGIFRIHRWAKNFSIDKHAQTYTSRIDVQKNVSTISRLIFWKSHQWCLQYFFWCTRCPYFEILNAN